VPRGKSQERLPFNYKAYLHFPNLLAIQKTSYVQYLLIQVLRIIILPIFLSLFKRILKTIK
jgi:hypothetical protein